VGQARATFRFVDPVRGIVDPDAHLDLPHSNNSATSPKLAEKLGFEGGTRRDRPRTLMSNPSNRKRLENTSQSKQARSHGN